VIVAYVSKSSLVWPSWLATCSAWGNIATDFAKCVQPNIAGRRFWFRWPRFTHHCLKHLPITCLLLS